MSIYSGFATRNQQQTYDQIVDSLLYILQKRVMKIYTKQQVDEVKFQSVVVRLYNQMKNMQKSKYLQPKSSYAIEEIVDYFGQYNSVKSKEHSIQYQKQPSKSKHLENQFRSNHIVHRKKQVHPLATKRHFSPSNKKLSSVHKLHDTVDDKKSIERPLSHAKYIAKQVVKKDQISQIISDYIVKAKKKQQKGNYKLRSHSHYMQMFNDYK